MRPCLLSCTPQTATALQEACVLTPLILLRALLVCHRAPMPKKRKSFGCDKAGRPVKSAAQATDGLVDLWGSEPAPTKDEDFEDEALAIAAGKRTAYGYMRPAKRR